MRAMDCQSFAGGFALGMVQAGFTLAGKRELPGGFGVPNMEANRHLLGRDWVTQVGPGHSWEAERVPVVFGNPPCSGFSLMSNKKFRGIDSPVNSCMWALIEFASRCDPEVVVFESVQQAYTQGKNLMTALRDRLEENTGHRYTLFHVLHNNLAVGGAALRKRYFFLAARVPFGVEHHELTRVPLLQDVIGDLSGLPMRWEPQPYHQASNWWLDEQGMRNPDGTVCGHAAKESPSIERCRALIEGVPWHEGEVISVVAKRYYDTHGTLPPQWAFMQEKLLQTDWRMGYYQIFRARSQRVARVVTGGALDLTIHPTEPRTLTHREVARIQGFPDTWNIHELRGARGLHMTWGKGIPVQCGRWIGSWIRSSVNGEPGSYTGVPDGDREFKIDFTNDHRPVCAER